MTRCEYLAVEATDLCPSTAPISNRLHHWPPETTHSCAVDHGNGSFQSPPLLTPHPSGVEILAACRRYGSRETTGHYRPRGTSSAQPPPVWVKSAADPRRSWCPGPSPGEVYIDPARPDRGAGCAPCSRAPWGCPAGGRDSAHGGPGRTSALRRERPYTD